MNDTVRTKPHLQLFAVGERCQLHPATDAWMSGDKFGVIVKFGRKWTHVKMDRSGKVRKVAPRDILGIVYP